MVSYNTKNKLSAKKKAAKARQRGYNANIYKKVKGWGVSVTRKNQESFLKPSRGYRRELSKYEKEMMQPLLSKSEEKKYLEESPPYVKEYAQKIKKLHKLKDTGASKQTILREIKKIKDEFYKQLIKEHPEEKQRIARLRKESEESSKIKLRTLELIRIAKQRPLTKKESRELKSMASKLK